MVTMVTKLSNGNTDEVIELEPLASPVEKTMEKNGLPENVPKQQKRLPSVSVMITVAVVATIIIALVTGVVLFKSSQRSEADIEESLHMVASNSSTQKPYTEKVLLESSTIKPAETKAIGQRTGELYPKTVYSDTEFCTSPVCKSAVQNMLSSLNTSVNPCDNFYNFACQGWQKNNPRPSYLSGWDTFTKLDIEIKEITNAILEAPISSKDSQALKKAKMFFQKCMATGSVSERTTLAAMLSTLESYGGWPILYRNGTWSPARFNWMESVVALKRLFNKPTLLDITSYVDSDGDTDEDAIVIKPPASLGHGKEDVIGAAHVHAILAILTHNDFVVNVSRELLRHKGAWYTNETYLSDKAFEIIYVQTELLKLREKPVSEDFKAIFGITGNYVEASISALQLVIDSFVFPLKSAMDLRILLNTLFSKKWPNINLASDEKVFVADIDYLLQVSKFLTRVRPEAIANYFHFQMVLEMSVKTTKIMQAFRDKLQNMLDGTTEQKPRHIYCSVMTKKSFLHALGQAYVKERYPKKTDSAKDFEMANELYKNIKVSFTKLMISSTNPHLNKTVLLLKNMVNSVCVGHPSWIYENKKVDQEYDGVNVNKPTFLEISMAVNAWMVDKELEMPTGYRESKGLLPTKQNESAICIWERYVGTAGAYYSIADYTVFLPIGIMQPPFYHADYPTVLNYAKLGSVVGHELTHGMEGFGWNKFKNGSLTPSAECFIKQYSSFSTNELKADNITLNGRTTLHENIADNAGLLEAFLAYKTEYKKSQKKKPVELEKYTDDQLFFIGYAQNFCETKTLSSMRKSMVLDKHSPGMFRILGTMINSPEFSQAWSCPVGSKMNPSAAQQKKCSQF